MHQKTEQCTAKHSVTKQVLLAIVETLKEFKGMLWGWYITMYCDHKNLMQNNLAFTLDRTYHKRLLLEEHGPTIMYIMEIHIVDAISCLDCGPIINDRVTWMTFTQCWCWYTVDMQTEGTSQADSEESMNLAFANCSKENAVYPLMIVEITDSQ